MQKQITVIIERGGDGYVSLFPELDIASQGTVLRKRVIISGRLLNCSMKQPHPRKSRPVCTKKGISRRWTLLLGKLRILSGKDACAILSRRGFIEVGRRGSHVVTQKRLPDTTITVPVPGHVIVTHRRLGVHHTPVRYSKECVCSLDSTVDVFVKYA